MKKSCEEKQLEYYKMMLGYINNDPECAQKLKKDNSYSILIMIVISLVSCAFFALLLIVFFQSQFFQAYKTCFLLLGIPAIIGSMLDYIFPYLDDKGIEYSFGGLILFGIIQQVLGRVESIIITILIVFLIIIKMEKNYKDALYQKASSKILELEQQMNEKHHK